MPTDDRPWSDADREMVAQAIRDNNPHEAWDETYPLIPAGHWAAAVLDALTAAGWRRESDVRAEVAEEIEQAIAAWVDHHEAIPPDAALAGYHASNIARAHATTKEPVCDD